MCGNTTELGDVGGKPGKTYLFFLTAQRKKKKRVQRTGLRFWAAGSINFFFIMLKWPRNQINWRWGSLLLLGKHLISEVSGAFPTALENPRERNIIIRTPGRTNNRIRSPRCVASSLIE